MREWLLTSGIDKIRVIMYGSILQLFCRVENKMLIIEFWKLIIPPVKKFGTYHVGILFEQFNISVADNFER